MNQKKIRVYFAVCFTFLLAAVVTIFPLPSILWWLRPHWLTLVLIYWVMFLPNSVGIISGFMVGILLDLLNGVSLGSSGLVLSCIAFLVIMLRPNLKQCRFWQQLVVVVFLVGLEQLLYLWLQLTLGSTAVGAWYWTATVLSIIAWPILYLFLQSYQKKLRLS